MAYDYREGKKRVIEILNNRLEVIEPTGIPNDQEFTFDNGYYCWVTGLFVNIRDSSKLFATSDKVTVSKIIRSFTSEIIEILRENSNNREIGIRGDCVYSIYNSPTKDSIYDIVDLAVYINTYMKMLSKILTQRKIPNISVGIGIATSQELIIKAGRKNSGINSKVWIGKAVTGASNLSSVGNKNDIGPIVISRITYDTVINRFL